jgi:predicted nucleic acid-binding protein
MIDFLKGNETHKAELLEKIIKDNLDFCISVLTYHEILQGARDEKEYFRLQSFFSTQNILHIPQDINFFNRTSAMYFSLRREGKTVRNSIDVMIAQQAIDGKHLLLHDDRDFDVIEKSCKNLKVLENLS